MGSSGPDNLFVNAPLNAYPNPAFQAARLARVNRVPAVDIDITGEVQERTLVADIEKAETVLRNAESFAQSALFMDLRANAPQRALHTLQQIQTLRAQHSTLVREYEQLQARRAESKSFKSRILHGRGATADTRMRAISVPQPFASAILYGIQTVVNRTAEASLPPEGAWFALHAPRKDAGSGRALFADAWLQRTQKPLVLAQLPKSAILGFVHIARCVQKDRCNASFALGPYCFLVDDVLALRIPYNIPGQQGLWQVPQEVVNLFNQLRTTAPSMRPLPCTTAPAGGASFHSNCLGGSTSADPNVDPPAVPAPPLVPLFTAASASTPPVEVSSLESCSSTESPRYEYSTFAAGVDLLSCGIAPTTAPEATRGSDSFQGSPAPAVNERASPPESCAPLTTMPSLAEAATEELVPGPAPTEPASQASVDAAPAAAAAPPSHARACPTIAKGQAVFVELEYPRANIRPLAPGLEYPRDITLGDDTFQILRLRGIADSALHPDAPADYDHFNKHDESSELLRVVLKFDAVPFQWRPITHLLFAPSVLEPGGTPMYDSMLIDEESKEILFDLSYNTYGLFWFHRPQQPLLVPEQSSNMFKLQIYACRNARLLSLGRSPHESDQPQPPHAPATAARAPAPPPAASHNAGQEPFSDSSIPSASAERASASAAPVPATARGEDADLLPKRMYRRSEHEDELVRYNPSKEIATHAPENVRQLRNDHRLNVPAGFPEGPIQGDSAELLLAVNTYCKDVTTGNGGHGVKFSASAAPPPLNPQARGFTRWVRCAQFRQNDDTSCKWRVQFEFSTSGWVLVSCPTAEHSHALLQTEAQSMAAASTRMGVPRELWALGHALARAGKSAGCMHGVLLKAAYDQNLCTQFDTQDIRRRFGEQRGDRALDATNLTSFLQDRVRLVAQPTNPNPPRHTVRAQARAPP